MCRMSAAADFITIPQAPINVPADQSSLELGPRGVSNGRQQTALQHLENSMDLAQVIALSMGLAWASGINMYAAIAMLGILGATGHMTLPPGLELLADPLVIMAAAFMYCVEFFADKVPGVDTAWDSIHTFLRIPAGAVLAAMALGDVSLPAQIAAGLIGGTLTAATHATKAGARVMINTSPEPMSNWGASVAEDVAVFAGLWVALNYPWLFLALLVVFIGLMIWLLPKLWRSIKTVFGALARWIGGGKENKPGPPSLEHTPRA